MIDFAKELNPEQYAAATAGEGPLLVLAAAGTGKTRTLVHRVAYLVGQGVPAHRMLLLTFTNKAAREMLERAEQLIGGNCAGIWSGTFHSVCARFLRRYGSFLGYKPGFTILDEDDQKKLMGECLKAVAGKEAKDMPKKETILKMISDAANYRRDFRTLVEISQSRLALDVEKVVAVGERYVARKRELGAMDFDDLLVNGLRLLKEVEGVRAELQEQFLHVLVDEYQDTNALQAEFTDILAAKHRNIMVVGDDFQCIYTWRGAQYENIMRFPERWPGCRILKLERNYRSLKPVLDVANTIMKDVKNAFDKTLRPARTAEGVPPQVYRMWDAHGQADLVLQLVNHLRVKIGFKYDDIAVLYRSHYSSIDIQLALTRARIPFKITSGVGVFEQLHVKDVLSYLRLCADPHQELAFERFVRLLPGVGEAGAKRIWVKIGRVFDPTDPMDRMNLESALPAKAKPNWEGIAKACAGAKGHLEKGEDHLLVEDFTRLFYADHLQRSFDAEEAASRLEDLGELSAQIASYAGGMKAFLEEVALLTNLDTANRANLPADHMHLTTVHQAKGMEWPVVILPWLTTGVFPSGRAVEEGNIDEERRLFYVAVTRAKDRLYLLSPRTRKTADGGAYPADESVFLKEIPKELVQTHDVRTLLPDSPYGGSSGSDGFGYGYGGGWQRHPRQKPESSYATEWRR